MNRKLAIHLYKLAFLVGILPAFATLTKVTQPDRDETGSSSVPKVLPLSKELPFPSLKELAFGASMRTCTTVEEYLTTLEVLPPDLYDEIASLFDPSQYAQLENYAKRGLLRGSLFNTMTQQYIDHGNACVAKVQNTSSFLRDMSIYLFSLNIVIFPPALIDLTLLNTVNLSKNNLYALPPEIRRLYFLTILDVSNNRLQTLPAEIGHLSLVDLILSHNQIKTLPPEIGRLSRLKHLDLSHNQIKTIPPEIEKLTQLLVLKLGYNQIETIPSEIGKLTQLLVLILNHNKLQTLPAEIEQLHQLEHLFLSDNQIQTFPPGISKLSQLGYLYISNNAFISLPLSIKDMSPRIKAIFTSDS